MTLSLKQAKKLQLRYQPNKAVSDILRDKSLIMIVGPVATGKTHIIKYVSAMHPEFGPVPVFTTREARADDDPTMFRFMTHNQASIKILLEKIDNGNVVQYAIHPTNERFYGSEPQDYPKKYNLLATLSNVAESMSQLPFQQTRIVSLVCTPQAWQSWLNKRFREENEDKQKRLKEAVQSLEWLIAHEDIILWVENIPEHPETTANKVVDAVIYNKIKPDTKHLAYKMLHYAKGLL